MNSSEIPQEIMGKIKEGCENISPEIRPYKFKCDYKNVRLHETINIAKAYGRDCTILEYDVPLLDENNKPLLDRGGKKDFIKIHIYVLEDGKPYRHDELLNLK